jgi:D-alanyl-D-alanine carboxypeptidase (penicillin-binding protein 5/6)
LLLLVAVLVLAWAATASAAAPAPRAAAKAVVVVNAKTADVLVARNADGRVPMASITKLMTALVVLEHTEPDEVVTVRGPAPSVGGSTVHLAHGERISVRDLLAAALIQSANDAAYALAVHVGEGSVRRFVALMNEKAAELGLENTHYARPDGLDAPRHYSSAADTVELARKAMAEPLVRRLVRRRTLRIAGGRVLHTWNDLLTTFPGLVGVKTGHTDGARWSQVAAARRDGVSLYAVLLGGPTRARRNADLAALLEWGFDQYGRVTLIRGGERYATAAIPFSEERAALVASENVERVIRLGGTQFVERIMAPAMQDPPVEAGEPLGEVVITARGRVIARTPLVATRAVEERGLGGRVAWYADRALDEAGDMLATVVPGLG